MTTTHCPMCGALVDVVGAPDFPGDDKPTTMHYAPKCEALMGELYQWLQLNIDGLIDFVPLAKRLNNLVAEMDGHE